VMDRALRETGVADRERSEVMGTFHRAALMLVNAG
jgi:truncated hemoglobin YjbI